MGRAASSLAVAITVGVWLYGSHAYAHPLVDEARSAADRADFAGALAILDRAERSDDLDRAAAEELLLLRALASVGLGRQAEASRALSHLAAIAPSTALPDTVPPAIRDELARLAASVRPVTIAIRIEALPDGSHDVHAVLDGEPGVVREVRVQAHRAGGAAVAQSARGATTATIHLPANAGSFEVTATLVGPGGAVVGEAHESVVGVRSRGVGGAERESTGPVVAEPQGRDLDRGSGALWPILGVSFALALAGAVVATVLVVSSDGPAYDPGSFGTPTVTWP